MGADEHGIVKHEGAFGSLHFRPKSGSSAGEPKVVLVKQTGPISGRLTQSEIADSNPVSDSAGSDQPNRKRFGKIAHDIEGAIGGAIIDNHQLEPVDVLARTLSSAAAINLSPL